MKPDNGHLPRILCLHGGGTSALIFSFQTRKLVNALQSDFRLVFVDAPLDSGPGPGVAPIFESAGPFHQWIATNEEEEERIRTTLQRELQKEDGAPFVGVLGFSQGARIATGLLQEQEHTPAAAPHLYFGVLINGSYPPLRQSSNPSTILPRFTESAPGPWIPEHEACVHRPTVHVHGRSDSYIERSRLLARCYDPSTATVMEFDNGHHLPTSDADTQTIAAEVVRIYQQESRKHDASGE
ncbi:hypothetical protein MMC07_009174 [Pseudocyphellaria aurata]|nr:hypothetical protein [Pseudocyphellaria aurata]